MEEDWARRELPDAGVGDAGFGGSAGHTGLATIPARELDQRYGADGQGQRARRFQSLSHEARYRPRGDRPRHCCRRRLRMRPGRCRLSPVSVVPAGAQRTRLVLGRRHSPAPEGLSRRRAVDLSCGRTWKTAVSACARRQIPSRPCHARRGQVAADQLAPRHQGPSEGSLCRHACAHRRWRPPADRHCWCTTYARRRGLAGWRASLERRAEILTFQPTRRRCDQGHSRCHQGALDLRAGAPATQGGTRTRPFRGPLLDGATSTRAHDNDCLCLPANAKARSDGAEKKSLRPAASAEPAGHPTSHN